MSATGVLAGVDEVVVICSGERRGDELYVAGILEREDPVEPLASGIYPRGDRVIRESCAVT